MTVKSIFKILPIFFLLNLYGCNVLDREKPSKKEQFSFPELTNSKIDTFITVVKHEANGVSEVFPLFIGKYKFSQQKIDLGNRIVDTSMLKDFIRRYELSDIADSLDITGLELLVDYKMSVGFSKSNSWRDTILYEYYPVYFVNSTNADKFFLAKDSYVFGLQEASTEEEQSYKKWMPIEGLGLDWCGLGHWGVVIHPQEYLLILMKKYNGDYTTDLRVRFKVGENIYVSKAFEGKINKAQFNIKENTYHQMTLSESYNYGIQELFLGAFPKMD